MLEQVSAKLIELETKNILKMEAQKIVFVKLKKKNNQTLVSFLWGFIL